MNHAPFATLRARYADETAALARRIAPCLAPGDVLCLEGGLGAGKTHFARALIAELTGETEVPSPTYTLVQTYAGPACEVWHADLYRLREPGEVAELGLAEAFASAIALVEWPDRLDPAPDALWLRFRPGDGPDARTIEAAGSDRWRARLAPILAQDNAGA